MVQYVAVWCSVLKCTCVRACICVFMCVCVCVCFLSHQLYLSTLQMCVHVCFVVTAALLAALSKYVFSKYVFVRVCVCECSCEQCHQSAVPPVTHVSSPYLTPKSHTHKRNSQSPHSQTQSLLYPPNPPPPQIHPIPRPSLSCFPSHPPPPPF